MSVAKIGNLKVKWSRRLPAAPTSLTVTKDSSGRCFLGFVVETEPDVLTEVETEAGIDLGLTAFAVLSDGSKINNPRFLRRAEKKLKRLQRELSRKTKGSQNRAKGRPRGVRLVRVRTDARVQGGQARAYFRQGGPCFPVLPRTVHDRDHNAARNVLFEGRRIVAAGRAETPNACGAPVRRAQVPAQRVEAGSPGRVKRPRPDSLDFRPWSTSMSKHAL